MLSVPKERAADADRRLNSHARIARLAGFGAPHQQAVLRGFHEVKARKIASVYTLALLATIDSMKINQFQVEQTIVFVFQTILLHNKNQKHYTVK